MKTFKKLFIGNPLILASFSDARRVTRAMSGSKSGTLLVALACIPLALVVTMTLAFGSSGGSSAANVCFMIAVVAQYLIIPPIFFNTVAGERERGSWELLRVAPVTTVQVLIGKYLSGLLILAPWFIALGLSVLTVHIVALFEVNTSTYFQAMGIYEFVGGFAVVFSQALLLSALAVFLSSRMKKAFSALLATYGIVALSAILVPFVFSILAETGDFTGRLWEMMQPIGQISLLARWQDDSFGDIMPWPLFALLYLIFSTILLVWSAFTLDFPDRDLKFVKNKGK